MSLIHALEIAAEVALGYAVFSCLCGGAWIALVTALRGRGESGAHLT